MNSLDNFTLTVGVMLFFEGTHVDWGLLMAASVLMTLPMAILFMAFNAICGGFRRWRGERLSKEMEVKLDRINKKLVLSTY